MKKKITAIVMLFLLTGFLWPGSIEKAYACSCPILTFEEGFKNADKVFSGKVMAIKKTGSRENGLAVKLNVQKTWKNTEETQMIVYTALDSAGCGFHFEEGKEYLVYTSENQEGKDVVSLCSRTALLEDADEDLAKLGAGAVPQKQSKAELPLSFHQKAGAFGFVFLSAAAAFLIYRKKK
jgi:hypothetical protein